MKRGREKTGDNNSDRLWGSRMWALGSGRCVVLFFFFWRGALTGRVGYFIYKRCEFFIGDDHNRTLLLKF